MLAVLTKQLYLQLLYMDNQPAKFCITELVTPYAKLWPVFIKTTWIFSSSESVFLSLQYQKYGNLDVMRQ